MRKYEIYLPLRYNNGKRIEPTKISNICERTYRNFRRNYRFLSSLSARIRAGGNIKARGVEYIDDIIKIEVVADQGPQTKEEILHRIIQRERLKIQYIYLFLRQIDYPNHHSRDTSYLRNFFKTNLSLRKLTSVESIPTTSIPSWHREKHDPKDFGSRQARQHQPGPG